MTRRASLLLVVALGLTAVALRPLLAGPPADPEVAAQEAVPFPDEPYRTTGPYLAFADRPDVTDADDVRLDADGIPLVRRNGHWAHNPVTIAQHGLQAYGRWLRSPRDHEQRAIVERTAGWLVREQDSRGAWYVRYDWTVDNHGGRLRAPWVSGIVQGQAISLLLRAHRLGPDPEYLRTARRALRPLLRPVSRGGVQARVRGNLVLEDEPTRVPSALLDGWLQALIGVYDASTRFPEARELFSEAIGALPRLLPLYDVDGRPAYHLAHITASSPHASLAPPLFQRIDVAALSALHDVAPHPVIARYRDRWRPLTDPEA